jgi:hypothetical protein
MKLRKSFKACRQDDSMYFGDMSDPKNYGKKCAYYIDGICSHDKRKCVVVTYKQEANALQR